MRALLTSLTLLGCSSLFAGDLKININSVQPQLGPVIVKVFNSDESFPRGKPFYSKSFAANGVSITYKIDDIPPGNYAVLAMQDVDRNGTMTKNWIGFPKEPFGISNDPSILSGPPSFEDASFQVGQKPLTEININLD